MSESQRARIVFCIGATGTVFDAISVFVQATSVDVKTRSIMKIFIKLLD